MTRLALPLAAAVASLLATATARADGLTVTTRELGTWNDALAQLRADLEQIDFGCAGEAAMVEPAGGVAA